MPLPVLAKHVRVAALLLLLTSQALRSLTYVFLAVVLGAATLAYPLCRSTAGLEEDELASDLPE